jgi:proteic killer suppression protein
MNGADVEISYKDNKLRKVCTEYKLAIKFFGGNRKYAEKLFSRINAIEQATNLKDIILYMPQFHFHKLKGNYEGFFAIDLSSRANKWRIILQPLDDNKNIFNPCNIDEIADKVRIVEIIELSAHYE